jgi:hypothetical protein
MRWLAKSMIHNTIVHLPRQEEVNYFLQRRVSRRLPLSWEMMLKKVSWATRHLEAVRRHGPDRATEDLRFMEMGAGWDLVVPLSLWMSGVERQVVIDISPHVRLELLNDALARLGAAPDAVAERLASFVRPVDPTPVCSLEELHRRFGIDYQAPVNGGQTPFERGSFDAVISSDTLEHIPKRALAAVLVETRRLLSDRGVMSHLIDMMDHYRYVDRSITVYNFLQYGDRAWSWLNSPIEHQNRLRLPDYRTALEDAGFRLLAEEVRWPRDEDLARLRAMALAPRFRRYELDELGAKAALLVATPV